MKKLMSKGFTLIELLVVITIIGILATGATAVYTSAQQKARDSIRQTDVLALRSAAEQSFGDKAAYPESTTLIADLVTAGYMQALPNDPKDGQIDSETMFSYTYGASKSADNDVQGQEYEFSANFENSGNANSKELTGDDGGDDEVRWEIGVGVDSVCSFVDVAGTGFACTDAATGAIDVDNDYNNDGTEEVPAVINSSYADS